MEFVQIDDPIKYIFEMGSFHDVSIVSLNLSVENLSLSILLDDINGAFEDLPEYLGKQSGTIEFCGISICRFNFDCSDDLIISDASIMAQGDEFVLSVDLRYSSLDKTGKLKGLSVNFKSLRFMPSGDS